MPKKRKKKPQKSFKVGWTCSLCDKPHRIASAYDIVGINGQYLAVCKGGCD